MTETCPKCGTANQADRSTCISCGAELEVAFFAEMFGPPSRLKSRYAIQRMAQRGTAVSLYHAIDTRNKNRPCLVHQVVLSELASADRELLEHRFLERAATWKTRQHPNLLRILDADIQHHRLYLVTDPIKGVSLRTIARDRQQDISEQALLRWAGQLCDLLQYLHSQEPPHVLGCLSPATVHIDEAGNAQVIEVGLLRHRQSGLVGPARGVRGYAAPEQRAGKVTPLSDLYTLGIILYQLITRADPRERPLPPLRKYAHGFSERTLGALPRAYRRDPEKRYQSAAEMRQALLGDSSGPALELPPFSLVDRREAKTIPDLVQLCVEHWDDGLLALMTGRIADWLTASAHTLSADGHDDDAARVAQLARRTALAQQQIQHDVARPGITASAREVAHHAAYSSWLQDMGALGIRPRLETRPTAFDFGVIAARVKATTALQIRNQGQGYLSGRVESRLPWIVIPDPVFGCRAGDTTEVRIEALGRRLAAGDVSVRQAIHIVSNGGNAWVEASASASAPVLSVTSRDLSFGPVTRGATRVEHLVVTNAGGGRLSGLVVPRAPWLRVRHPTFSCPAGASAQIAVELLSQDLPKGAVRIRRALAIDSDSGQAEVDVRWKWARPSLELDAVGLDLGSVARGTRAERTLTLTNRGTAELIGEAVSQVEWLSVEPATIRCAPGVSQVLSITCDTESLPGGGHVEPAAIAIRANAGTQTVSASIEVLAPRLVVDSLGVDLGDVRDGGQVEETITVGNQGSLPWEGRAVPAVSWLSVEPEEIRCEPGHFMPVTVMLRTESLESGGDHRAEQAIRIRGPGEERWISAHVHLVRPELHVERHSLDLGIIGRTDIVTVPIEITNLGTGELEWEISVRGTWLETVSTHGVCSTGETATAQVRAYAMAVDGDSGSAWLTVNSNGGRVDLPAAVSLSSPQLSVEPQWLNLRSDNYAPVLETARISNRGVGELSGTVEASVPWLKCSPASFSCAAGVSTEIEVRAVLDDLREGSEDALEAIQVQSNGGTETIGARLTLALAPELALSTDHIDLGATGKGAFELENRGYGTLRAQVLPQQDWLTVSRQDWTLKAGRRARVQVSLVDAPPGPPPEAEGTIKVHTPDSVVHLTVSIPPPG